MVKKPSNWDPYKQEYLRKLCYNALVSCAVHFLLEKETNDEKKIYLVHYAKIACPRNRWLGGRMDGFRRHDSDFAETNSSTVHFWRLSRTLKNKSGEISVFIRKLQ